MISNAPGLHTVSLQSYGLNFQINFSLVTEKCFFMPHFAIFAKFWSVFPKCVKSTVTLIKKLAPSKPCTHTPTHSFVHVT